MLVVPKPGVLLPEGAFRYWIDARFEWKAGSGLAKPVIPVRLRRASPKVGGGGWAGMPNPKPSNASLVCERDIGGRFDGDAEGEGAPGEGVGRAIGIGCDLGCFDGDGGGIGDDREGSKESPNPFPNEEKSLSNPFILPSGLAARLSFCGLTPHGSAPPLGCDELPPKLAIPDL